MSLGRTPLGLAPLGLIITPGTSSPPPSGFFARYYFDMREQGMFKNVGSQKIAMFAFDVTTGLPKTGDAANITPYVSKDYGTVTVLGTTTATEMDATNAKGWYSFVLTQAETNGDSLVFTAKSSTSNVSLVGVNVATAPNRFTTMVIDAAGLVDANAVKIGPTGAGIAQAARDIGTSVLLSTGTGTGQLDFTSGVVKANATQWLGGTIPAVNVTGVPLVDAKYLLGTVFPTPTVAGVPNVNVKTWNDLATVALPLIPTVAGRALDVSAGGEAGLDWANVGSPTTSLALTGTTIAVTQKVDVDTIKTNPVVNAGTVTFPTTATLASTTNITAGTITTVTNLTNAPTAGDLTATMKTSVTTAATAATPIAASVAGAVGSVTAGVTITTNNDKTGMRLSATGVNDVLRTALTEGYAADGATFTLEQGLYMLWSALQEFAISGTTITGKQLDGSATSMTWTLDSATVPTSRTRAS